MPDPVDMAYGAVVGAGVAAIPIIPPYLACGLLVVIALGLEALLGPRTDERAQVVDTPDDDPRTLRDTDGELPEAYPDEDEPPSLEW